MTAPELTPGQRVLIEAEVVEPIAGTVWLKPLSRREGRPLSWTVLVDAVRWHLDDRAERDAERDRLAAELAETIEERNDLHQFVADLWLATGRPRDADSTREEVIAEVRGLRIAYREMKALQMERDAAIAAAGPLGDKPLAVVVAELIAERDAALAQVAAMRDVVKAAPLLIALWRACLDSHSVEPTEEQIRAGYIELVDAASSHRVSDALERLTAFEPLLLAQQGADGLGEGHGSADGVEGGTAVCGSTDRDLSTNRRLICERPPGHDGLHHFQFEADDHA